MATLIYCPICGHMFGQRREGGRLRQACPNCGYVHYVNPVPAVGLLIEMDGGLVLICRGQAPHKGEWTLPSGFIEADESAEDAAVREAEEETGLKTEIIELAGVNSFPEGPPTSGIIIFFRLRPVGGELRGGDDATEARVFQPHELPVLPFRTHREAVAQWLEQRQRQTGEMQAIPRKPRRRPFLIRPAEAADADEIMGLLALIPANRDLPQEAWQEIRWRFRESNGFEIFVAEANQQPPLIIGFITLSIVRTLTEGRGFISDMAVLPTYQRRGVGAALLEAALQAAERHNLSYIQVNAERANERARAFYAALGFSEDTVMRLRLR
ncbi:MAG: GNAT family N-acetyltransferase [Chloroflexi bacterium]|nr:GNAT family N-acetyltransferase [Chloroflexota bacterium]